MKSIPTSMITAAIFAGVLTLTCRTGAAETPAAQPIPVTASWQMLNIGDSPVPGKASFQEGAFSISGSGKKRIWGPEDSFNFVYQKWTGDGTLTVQLTDVQDQVQQHFDTYGVMFRSSLDKSAPMFAMAHCTYSTDVLVRKEAGEFTPDLLTNATNQAPPIWLRVTREGSKFTGAYSTDGKKWTAQASETLDLPAEVYVGLCVTSCSDEQASRATFTNVKLEKSVPAKDSPPAN